MAKHYIGKTCVTVLFSGDNSDEQGGESNIFYKEFDLIYLSALVGDDGPDSFVFSGFSVIVSTPCVVLPKVIHILDSAF